MHGGRMVPAEATVAAAGLSDGLTVH
eukprot:SAG11_NODE_5984_length_1418_cov_3.246399_2_plen_25_part_01